MTEKLIIELFLCRAPSGELFVQMNHPICQRKSRRKRFNPEIFVGEIVASGSVIIGPEVSELIPFLGSILVFQPDGNEILNSIFMTFFQKWIGQEDANELEDTGLICHVLCHPGAPPEVRAVKEGEMPFREESPTCVFPLKTGIEASQVIKCALEEELLFEPTRHLLELLAHDGQQRWEELEKEKADSEERAVA